MSVKRQAHVTGWEREQAVRVTTGLADKPPVPPKTAPRTESRPVS